MFHTVVQLLRSEGAKTVLLSKTKRLVADADSWRQQTWSKHVGIRAVSLQIQRDTSCVLNLWCLLQRPGPLSFKPATHMTAQKMTKGTMNKILRDLSHRICASSQFVHVVICASSFWNYAWSIFVNFVAVKHNSSQTQKVSVDHIWWIQMFFF